MDKTMPAQPAPMRVTPEQLATIIVFEAQVRALETGAQMLGDMLGLKSEAEVLVSARNHLVKALNKMKTDWDRKVIVASPAEVPQLMVEP